MPSGIKPPLPPALPHNYQCKLTPPNLGILPSRWSTLEGAVETSLSQTKELIPATTEVLVKSKEEMSEYVGCQVHRGYFALGKIPPPRPSRAGRGLARDGLSHAENVGPILWNCAALGVGGVIAG